MKEINGLNLDKRGHILIGHGLYIYMGTTVCTWHAEMGYCLDMSYKGIG